MSTVVAKGRAKGVVVRIGDDTEIGKISKLITNQPHQQTNIQRKLAALGKWLILVAFLLCALVVVIGVSWGNGVEETVRIGVSLAVSVIPEGLVAVTTGKTIAINMFKLLWLLVSREWLNSMRLSVNYRVSNLLEVYKSFVPTRLEH
jgi:P-type E1-E2 ATPase